MGNVNRTIEIQTKTKVKNHLKRNTIKEVKKHTMTSKKEVKPMIQKKMNLVGTLKNPTSKIKIKTAKLKISTSKRIKEAKMEKRNSIEKIQKKVETMSKIRKRRQEK